MASPNPTVLIMQCLVVLFALLTASTTQGRSLQRVHKRHDGGSSSLMDVEYDREMIEEMERDSLPSSHLRRQHSRRQHSGHHGNLIRKVSADYDEMIRAPEDEHRRRSTGSSERIHALKKRHNQDGRALLYETMSEQAESDFQQKIVKDIHRHNKIHKIRRKRFEVELKEAQNSSLCNYTVTEIPDMSKDQSRIPKKLIDVKCNHAGLKCREPGTHYCLQTYGTVEVSYSNGTTEAIKVLTGCVCALRDYAQLSQFKPHVLNDWADARS